ncbi:MAG: linear amide C-N hydrolase [Gammaproteobacteria bacterium]|nr:linear amide C-N hydrolase [Gammaproteobacteria bacterium]
MHFNYESCSTFLLNKGGSFLIGHNLDERTAEAQPGSVFVNKRGEHKSSVSFERVFGARDFDEETLHWTSIHGSVSFSSLGKNFIDGGYNEAGLYIQEMSLEGGALPMNTSSRTRMFMTLWMQYVLDCFTTVAEVIRSLSDIAIDGWPWHFFVCDAKDNHCCIDYIDGEAKIYSGTSMPHAVMTNYEYHQELDGLRPYQGFGGEQVVDLKDLGNIDPPRNTRFIQACHMIKHSTDRPDVDEAFNILYTLDRGALKPPGGRHWSYVIDARAGRVYMETRTSPKRRYFDLGDFNFSDGKPSQLVDIHIERDGDIRELFGDVTVESNRAALERCTPWWTMLFNQAMAEMEAKGEPILDIYKEGSWELAVDRMADHAREAIE